MVQQYIESAVVTHSLCTVQDIRTAQGMATATVAHQAVCVTMASLALDVSEVCSCRTLYEYILLTLYQQ
jgi:hypothetical protein